MKHTSGGIQLAICTLATFAAMSLVAGSASAQDLIGKGEWRSVSSDMLGGTWTAKLKRSGGSVSGTLSLTGSNVLTGSDVAGSIDTSSIVLGLLANAEKMATFSAKLDGKSISGEWECDAVKDQGVWYGTLVPATAAADAASP